MVIKDLLDMLKDHLQGAHGETLEWIIIILVLMEVIIGVVTIVLDVYALFGRESGGGH